MVAFGGLLLKVPAAKIFIDGSCFMVTTYKFYKGHMYFTRMFAATNKLNTV